jgi:glycerol-3-phosphate O-acyltransferase
MQLLIFPTRLISEVQKEFAAIFPFLKLEFFSGKANRQTRSTIFQIISNSKRISDCQSATADGILEFEEEMKVAELENQLKNRFHLNAQVFRRSGNTWLQTTMTDNWTLQKQNEHGKEISQPARTQWINENFKDEVDYD